MEKLYATKSHRVTALVKPLRCIASFHESRTERAAARLEPRWTQSRCSGHGDFGIANMSVHPARQAYVEEEQVSQHTHIYTRFARNGPCSHIMPERSRRLGIQRQMLKGRGRLTDGHGRKTQVSTSTTYVSRDQPCDWILRQSLESDENCFSNRSKLYDPFPICWRTCPASLRSVQ